nr:NAD(P)H-binding protein [Glycomyces arizonensis]
MIVVTAATGALGTHVVEQLLERVPADRVAVVVRDEAKAAPFAERGVEVRVADYGEPDTLKGAFGEGDKVLLISGSEIGRRVKQHSAVIDAAKDAGVALLAYTSVLGEAADDSPLADEHRATERYLIDSGLPYVLLRNGWYHEVATGQLDRTVAAGGIITSAGADSRVASAARADYAAAAVAVLTGEGHVNRTYELSGDAAWSFAEYGAEVARRLGREFTVKAVSPEVHREILLGAGVPASMVDVLVEVDGEIALGHLAYRNGDLSALIGRPTTPIADAVAAALETVEA